jgi:alpha,alpha-trehalase
MSSRYTPIRDYAVIGDCHGAALVSRDGSIDWCCLARFDAEPIFCGLLDEARGGAFAIAADQPAPSTRAYEPGTNVLVTTVRTAGGTFAITDFMPVGRTPGAGAHDYTGLTAPGCLVRVVEGLEGTSAVRVQYQPTSGYGRVPAELRQTEDGVADAAGGPRLFTDVPVSLGVHGAVATFVLGQGDRRSFAVTPRDPAPGWRPRIDDWLATTRAFWREWSEYCRYQGPYREAVLRSALALKLLTYAPTGAIAAAATTSLPEEIGGERNWDYRYCWLRDATFTLHALAALGYSGEARRFTEFLHRACAVTYPRLQIMYGIGYEATLAERRLDHLHGYCGSRPVRVGNGAYDQRQLDIYGEVLDAAWLHRALGGRFSNQEAAMLLSLADMAERHWHEPDQGLWEMRGPAHHHVHSKVMAWVAVDRALRLFGGSPARHATRQRIVDDVLAHGVDPRRGHLVQRYGSSEVDAALLVIPLLGFPVDEATLARTVAAIQHDLGEGPFVHRYRGGDGVAGGEGAFLICSFWLVDALLTLGRFEEACALFERLLACANDVGLYAEEIDPPTSAFLGNFPQAFTHLALIQSAALIALAQGGGQAALAGTHADRARRSVDATVGPRALWAAFKTFRRVGRLRSSTASVLPSDSATIP